jgi:hypothetical protein
MCSYQDAIEGLLALVKTATSGLTFNSIPIQMLYGTRYPSDKALMDAVNTKKSVIALYNRQTTYKDVSMPYLRAYTDVPAQIVSTTSQNRILPSATATITITNAAGFTSVASTDYVSCNVLCDFVPAAAVAPGQSGQSTTWLAGQLAAAINALAGFAGIVTATSSGNVVTITNISSGEIRLFSNVGFQRQTQIGGSCAHESVQVILWSPTLDQHDTIFPALEALLSSLDYASGFRSQNSGEFVNLKLNGHRPGDADIQKDIYRADFLIELERSADANETLYAVVAPIFTVTET